MNTRRLLSDASALKRLADRLSECPEVTRFNQDGNNEAWVLAHALGDLEESFGKFLEEQLPKLTDDHGERPEIYDLLLEIGEEFRHILYHIRDPRFYRYLDAKHDD